ncbi:MAG: glycosyltransferase family 1 protein [Sphingopyxis sp.]|nr:glycosyltransferase family 1 protein [Sphingopyxis sp.]
MQTQDLRIALFSGNYNYVRDGANQALNRLVAYLLRQGAAVRVYSPTVAQPAFEPAGDLVSLPSIAIPGRPEYRLPLRLSGRIKADLEAFAPNIVHISSPDRVARQARKWAANRDLPVLASVHTRFETYFRYYNMSFVEPLIEAWLRKLYRRCDALVAPSESMAQVLREQRMNYDIDIWSRGVDREIFDPARRDLAWRQKHGIADATPVIGFLGRLVMEKGLDVFSDTIDQLKRRGVDHDVLVVGEGPAREWFESRLPGAHFVGFQGGADLARAIASMDMLFNPSVTETFGNVTLEAMACGRPVVAADATGSDSLVSDGKSGRLIRPGAIGQYADALAAYCADPALRSACSPELLAHRDFVEYFSYAAEMIVLCMRDDQVVDARNVKTPQRGHHDQQRVEEEGDDAPTMRRAVEARHACANGTNACRSCWQ